MTSHFSTGTTRRNTPSWCKPGMYRAVLPYVDKRPATITAYAKWFGPFASEQIDMTETFQLRRNAAGNGYHGASTAQPPRLILTLKDHTDLRYYDVVLAVDLYGSVLITQTWYNVDVTRRLPWGTGIIRRVHIPRIRFIETQLLA